MTFLVVTLKTPPGPQNTSHRENSVTLLNKAGHTCRTQQNQFFHMKIHSINNWEPRPLVTPLLLPYLKLFNRHNTANFNKIGV